MNQSPPSYNPSDAGTLQGVMQFLIRKYVQGSLDGMLPAQVVVYDPVLNQATVQPLIQVVSTSGIPSSRAQLASIPVFALGCGTGLIRFNLQPGDLGWIVANDRDISLYMQSLAESQPNTERMHSFSDALFLPDKVRGYTVNPADATSDIILQTTDGATAFSIGPGTVTIRAAALILNALAITSTGGVGGGNLALAGKFGCNGATAQGPVTLANYPAVTTADAISLVNQLAALLIANGQAA